MQFHVTFVFSMDSILSSTFSPHLNRLSYATFFGGVTAMTREHIEKVRGLSNKYYGWGGEDDDLASRLKSRGYTIMRHPSSISRFITISHEPDKHNGINSMR